MSNLTAIILAAGKGTRMKSKLPKVLHKVGGLPMLQHVLDAADAAGCQKKVVIIGHEAELVEKMVGKQAQVVLQAEQLGTGHAVLQAEKALTGIKGTALILCGDTPLLRAEELTKFAEAHIKSGAAATVMTTMMENPFGYGRILRDAKVMCKASWSKKMLQTHRKQLKKLIPVFIV
jgi:bifunctional UDP-N-acetylglucosamine pyrophosphorylase/glucosamine-1-phosphate N-acetyltransferase